MRRSAAVDELASQGISDVVATDAPDWRERAEAIVAGGRVVAGVDSVGGTAAGDVPAGATTTLDPAVATPGGAASVTLDVIAPTIPGEYLLLLDVVSPARGPLSALGSAPALIRVTVVAPVVAPTPTAPHRTG